MIKVYKSLSPQFATFSSYRPRIPASYRE